MRSPVRSGRNRAVTPFFRVFGGCEQLVGEAVRRTPAEGHHRGEWRVLALLVPLVAGAAVFDGLWRLGGAWLAWVGVLPVLLVLLHLTAFFLGGRTPSALWWRWAALLGGWALWQILAPGSGTGATWVAWLWVSFLSLNFLGVLCLAWGKLMTHRWFCTTAFRWAFLVLAHVPPVLLWLYAGYPYAIGFLAAVGAVWASGTFLPNARIFGPVVSRVEGDEVLLTFDDGPDPHDTPLLLDLLDEHGRKAVFFVIGEKVRRYPELAREIVRRGHELGNHTMTHPVGFLWGAGSIRTRREITGCSRAIEEATGIRPRWFRAPAGHRNWFTHPILRECGLELIGWRKRAFDTIRSDVPGIVRCLTGGAQAGDILLLHEATPIAGPVARGVMEALADRKPPAATATPCAPGRSGDC